MIVYSIEPLEKCWDEITKLTEQHWHETMQWQHGKQPYNPSFERYNAYDKAGWLLTFTARDGEKLVGYAWIYIVPSMHTQKIIGTEDAIFILPEYRKGRNGLRFFEFVEKEVTARKACEMTATAKPDSVAARILEFMGYTVTDLKFSKHLN